ncbi:MAG: efflux RND transporter periplasmic adaptor subunit [Flavobacteriales bacterium]|nr:efflux RND transporter periplasmic adaptor subunit [Flavobacteriales bacterium]MCX7651135.1 efflux RND transporter periplasmic adaptor subunit [Flavobacteriales bacterium]MDW8431321.1 efflux RND transporter periplasmic adaptor subunit [Flavobacteriales bacterium]
MNIISCISTAALGLAIFSWCCTSPSKEEPETPFTMRGDTVFVTHNSPVSQKIKAQPLEEKDFHLELMTAGTVRAIPNYYAEIAPPFSGRVTKVHLRLGMRTQPGTPLFELVSPEFTEAQKLFFQAKSELASARLALKRQQDLRANGVGAERDLEEAETNYEVKEKEYQNAMAGLKIFGVDVEKLVLGQPLVITSPIAGEVIDNEVVNGHYIRADDPPHAKVAELSRVWVVGMVKEKDIRFIHELDAAEITVPAYPGEKFFGKVFHIDEVVDEETRSIRVLVECDNARHLLKPGMYATVKFKNAPVKALFVPARALLQYNDKSYVFVKYGENSYVRRFVETGISQGESVQIISGLSPGEPVVSEGAFYMLEAK